MRGDSLEVEGGGIAQGANGVTARLGCGGGEIQGRRALNIVISHSCSRLGVGGP